MTKIGLYILCALIFWGCTNSASEKKINKQGIVALGENLKEIRYEPANLNFKANEDVEITLVNESKHPSLFHNIVFCTFGKTNEIGFKAISAGKKNRFIPPGNKDVLMGSEMLKPGDSTTFVFKAPAAGKYSYVRTFPGHYQTMVGTLNIIAE